MVVSRPLLVGILVVALVAAVVAFWPGRPGSESTSDPAGVNRSKGVAESGAMNIAGERGDGVTQGNVSSDGDPDSVGGGSDASLTEGEDAPNTASALLDQLAERTAAKDVGADTKKEGRAHRNGNNGKGRETTADGATKAAITEAQQLIDTGSYEEAVALLEKTIANDPKNAQARKLLGNLLTSLGRTDEAVALYEDWRNQSPGDATPYLQLARLYGQLGAKEDALAYLNDFMQMSHDDIDAYGQAASLYRRFGMLDQEGALLAEWVAAAPESADALRSLGDYYRRTNQPEAAVSQYQRVADILPENVQAHRDLATAYLRTGEQAAAINELQVALSLRPGDLNAMLQLGDTYRVIGDPASAIGAYQSVIDADPNAPQADRAARFIQRVQTQVARGQQRTN